MRKTKNLDLELIRFQGFKTDVIDPILASLERDNSEPNPTYWITALYVYDTYGFACSRAFEMMIRSLKRGNIETPTLLALATDKVGHRGPGYIQYSPAWRKNEVSVALYKHWLVTTTELTGRSLVQFLEKNGATELVWYPNFQNWVHESSVQTFIDTANAWKQEDIEADNKLVRSTIAKCARRIKASK